MSLRVLVVAEDPLARAGLAILLANEIDCLIVGQISGDDLVADVDIYQPDVIVWDLGWDFGTQTPAEAETLANDETMVPPEEIVGRLLTVQEANLPVMILLPDGASIREVLSVGVLGLMSREVDIGLLALALQAVSQGLTVIDPIFRPNLISVNAVSESLIQNEIDNTLIEPLTPRESEVLQLLAEGLPNKMIGRRLNISDHTVKFHVAAVMTKLGAQSRTEAVVLATRLGLILL